MLVDTQALSELIGRKHRCLLELRELGKRQAALIDGGDMGELLRMFAGKQRLIDQLHEIERGLDPYRNQDPPDRIWPSAAARKQCGELIEESQRLLDAILDQEKQNESQLRLKREEAAGKLQSMHASRQARQAYGETQTPRLRGCDLSS